MNLGSTRVAGKLPNRLIRTNGHSKNRTLYLTFDDGPVPDNTPLILRLLDRYEIKASFFCVGENIDAHPEIVKSLLSSGHLLANHSDTHLDFRNNDLAAQLQEVRACQARIERYNRNCKKIFRAPRGQLNLTLLMRLKLSGWDIVHWSYDSLDYRYASLDEQLGVFQGNPVSGGDVILFHDDNPLVTTVLEKLIPVWLEQDFNFATVDSI